MGYSPGYLKQLRDCGCPGFNANGTFDSIAIKKWMLENSAKLPAPTAWKDALGMEKLRGEKRKNDLADGLLIEKRIVADRLQKIFRPAIAHVEQALLNQYPSVVVGLEVAAARVYGKRVLDAILDAHRKAADEWA
jgi:hypothetical protein